MASTMEFVVDALQNVNLAIKIFAIIVCVVMASTVLEVVAHVLQPVNIAIIRIFVFPVKLTKASTVPVVVAHALQNV
jgi:hypothetical protein